MYVLKYNDKYVADFGYPEPELTENINQAAYWWSKKDVRDNFRDYGYKLDKKYKFVECRLVEL